MLSFIPVLKPAWNQVFFTQKRALGIDSYLHLRQNVLDRNQVPSLAVAVTYLSYFTGLIRCRHPWVELSSRSSASCRARCSEEA